MLNLPSEFVIIGHMFDIWQIDLDWSFDWSLDKINRHYAVLSAEEQQRANRFLQEKHRRQYAISHIALRLILAEYLNENAADLRFTKGEFDKPALIPSQKNNVEFNLSHSYEKALIAVIRGQAVGVDLEFCKRQQDLLELAQRFFSRKECAQISQLGNREDQQQAFYRCWTRKEAFLKAIGRGISYGLDRFSVDLSKHPEQNWLSTPDITDRYQLILPQHDLSDYEMAVVVQGEVTQWQYRKWP